MQIFLDDQDYLRFLGILQEVVDRFAIQCWSYCLMPNHCHLALYPTLPNFSGAMQAMLGEYGRWWNWRHRRVGHVVQGRFGAQIVDTDEYLLALCRYIARNPVRAGLVTSPEEWRWSSHAATLGLVEPPAFLSIDRLLGVLGTDPSVSRARYQEFVRGAGDPEAEDRLRSNARILGSTSFKRRVAAELVLPPPAVQDRDEPKTRTVGAEPQVPEWGQTQV